MVLRQKILNVELEPANLEPLLYENGFISRGANGSWVPSFGFYVLFGLDVTDMFLHLNAYNVYYVKK